jgi:A/G-specific adenine glycosylase
MPEALTGLPNDFAQVMVRWQLRHGRHGLPWQGSRDPYRVWLSEIMLQQTQVRTVLDYYPRFLERFASVHDLAEASQDEVMGLWSGLGYYSRARNLHRCAQTVVSQWGGEFPRLAATLQTLPGIGRSTAAAIAAFCFDERAAILDGNVKRVLSRVLGFGADLSLLRHERQLWTFAQEMLPQQGTDMPAYTQALMDVGATLCLPRHTQCHACPASALCVAHAHGRMLEFPVKTRKIRRTAQSMWLLLAQDARGRVWLHKRPSHGIWAGLYCLPVFDSEAAVRASWPQGLRVRDLPVRVHPLTHRDLHLHTLICQGPCECPPQGDGQWVLASQWERLGLPAPVRALLAAL